MKRMKSWVLMATMVLTLIGMLSACSSEKENYLSSIPAESSLVIKLNIAQMVQKSNITNNPMVNGMLMQAEGNIPESLKEKFQAIKEDPRSAGIDLEKPLAIALILHDITDNFKVHTVTVAALSDGKKFNELMTQLAATEESISIEKASEGIQRIKITGNNEIDIVYNDNRIVATVTDDLNAVALINQKAEQSMLNNPDFEDFAQTTNDYAVFVDYTWITEMAKLQNQANINIPPTFELMKDCSIFCSVNFEQGKIVANSKFYANEEMKQLQETFYLKPSGKYVGLLPTNTYLAFNGGIQNFAEIFNFMGEKESKEIEQALQSMNLSKDIFNSIEGEFMLGVFDESNPQGIPGFILAAECKDQNLFDAIKTMTNQSANEGNVISIMNYYIAFIDNTLIATTKNIYDQCLAEGTIKNLNESMENTSLGNTLKKGGMVINFQAIANNELLKQMKHNREVNATLTVLKQLDYLTAQYENMQEGKAELTFKDSNKNALEQLISIGIGAAMALQ